ncbi:hypothetical protein AB833_19955 [Chromatiales bacterium (ex Bugula neritina AB1)]|nr:hypothetical protein AB833_19955 [Chromatiales bacterium (ex Bugula neritina AB1)]
MKLQKLRSTLAALAAVFVLTAVFATPASANKYSYHYKFSNGKHSQYLHQGKLSAPEDLATATIKTGLAGINRATILSTMEAGIDTTAGFIKDNSIATGTNTAITSLLVKSTT